MHLSSHLMMLMLAVVACRAAFIPNMMFSSGRNRHTQQQQQQQQQQQVKAFAQQQQQPAWRAAGNPFSPWDDGTETYGYLADRHPTNAMDDLTSSSYQPQAQLPLSQQPLVYGVPHRYLSEPLPNSYPMVASPTDELYNNELYNNALLMRGRGPFNSIKRSSSSSLGSFYDSSMDDDNVNFDDGLSAMASDYYDQPINHQDVVNFEKYVQRYFQQQPSEAEAEVDSQYVDYWNNGDDSEADNINSNDNYEVDNDEEAARQLHLLLNQQKQQRRPIALREIQKKSGGPSVLVSSAKSTSRTEAPVTTATTTTTSSATLAPHSQQGQKEEPLLRPPTPQRQPQPQQMSSPTASTTTTTSPTPSAAKKDVQDEDGNIYHTIQRLMNMRNRLQQKSRDDDIERDWEVDDENNNNNNRAKRFVAPSPDSLLNKQIHSLDKIRA